MSRYIKELENYGALLMERRRKTRTGNFYANDYRWVLDEPSAKKGAPPEVGDISVATPIWRRWIYAAYAITGVIIGATQVGFTAGELAQPVWLIVTLAVYAFVGGAVGLTATSRTPKSVEQLD